MSKNVINSEYFALNTGNLGGAMVYLAQIENACSILRVVNDSANSITLLVAPDAVAAPIAFDRVLPNTSLQIDFQANSGPPSYTALFQKNSQIYAISGTNDAGLLTLTSYYQSRE